MEGDFKPGDVQYYVSKCKLHVHILRQRYFVMRVVVIGSGFHRSSHISAAGV